MSVKEVKNNNAVIDEALSEVLENTKETKSFYEMWTDWIGPKIKFIKDTLQYNFPDLWEFNTLTTLSSVEDVLRRYESSFNPNNNLNSTDKDRIFKEQVMSRLCFNTYDIIIHFPLITIKNANKQRHDIHDLFIKISLCSNLKGNFDNYFFGKRLSYTLGEYQSYYAHSHKAGKRSSSWSKFCLGSTHFGTLCNLLKYEFNEDNFELFCTMLPDYLSWESKAGGAYMYFSDIRERSNQTISSISDSSIIEIYKQLLSKELDLSPLCSTNSIIDNLSFSHQEDYIKTLIKSVISENDYNKYMVIYEPSTGRTYPIINSREKEVEIAERELKSEYSITFNNEEFRGKLLDPKKEEIKLKNDQTIVPNPVLVSGIISHLTADINKCIYEQYI